MGFPPSYHDSGAENDEQSGTQSITLLNTDYARQRMRYKVYFEINFEITM